MDIREFRDIVKWTLENDMKGITIEEVEVVKINDQKLYGLAFKKDGEEAAPVVYMEQYYEDSDKHDEYYVDADIIEHIRKTVEESMCNRPLETSGDNLTWDAVKDHLTRRLISVARNKEYLADKPHKKCVGGEFAVLTAIDFGGGCSAVVTNSLMEILGVDLETLLLTSLKDEMQSDKAKLVPLSEALFGGGMNLLDAGHGADGPMILTNEDGVFGATVIFYGGMLSRIHELVGNYYALPSSVHEWVILPESLGTDTNELKNMVIDANTTVVSKDEFLSNQVFKYDLDGGFRAVV